MVASRRYFAVLGFALLSSSGALAVAPPADELKSLRERVEALEQKQDDNLRITSENANLTHAFLNDRLTLGGFFESALTELHGPETDFQIASSANTLGLNLAGEFSENLGFSSQVLTGLNFPLQNPDNDPRSNPPRRRYGTFLTGSALAQAYLEYQTSDLFQIQAGEGYVPFGIALQQRELVLFLRRGGPQIMRIPGLASPLWQGVHIHGTKTVSKSRIGYNVYTFNSFTDPRLLGLGTRAWWSSGDDSLSLGVSSQTLRENDSNNEVAGLDLKWRVGLFEITSEYARTFGKGDQPYSFYFEPHFWLSEKRWVLYTFFDYAKNAKNVTATATGTPADAFRRAEYGGGVNWLPTSLTRIRLGVFYFDYLGDRNVVGGPNRNFFATDASVAVAF